MQAQKELVLHRLLAVLDAVNHGGSASGRAQVLVLAVCDVAVTDCLVLVMCQHDCKA
jgi:hypothetical protein